MMRMSKGIFLAVAAIWSCTANSAGAPDTVDLPGLPAYCPSTWGGSARTKESVEHWEQRMGGGMFMHMHHYCWGLASLRKAQDYKLSVGEKRTLLSTAVKEIDYVLGHAQPDFVLLPEMLTKRGEALLRLKDYRAAEAMFTKAIETRKDYWPAYTLYAEALIDQGKRDQARDVLNNGIKQVSEPRMLQRMLTDLNARNTK